MPRPRKPPRLELRPDERTWVIRDGQRYVRTGCSEDQADKAADALQAYLAQRHTPDTQERRASKVKLADVLAIYLDARDRSVARPSEMHARIRRLNEYWGNRTAADIKGNACRDYVRLRGVVIAARRELETLRAATNLYAKEYGLDVVPQFTLPENSKSRERWLTRSEAARLLWAAHRSPYHKHLVRFILIGLYTGTRHRAILGLQWMPNTTGGWVDVERGVIHRRSAVHRETKKRQPPARLSPRLLCHLRRWRQSDHGVGPVVRYEGRRIGRLEKSFRAARSVAGCPDVTPHVLRHTFCTWLAQAGVPVWEAAGSAGMTVETFEAVYGHHSPDFQKNAAEAF